jgi:CDP-diacylglycerol--glycerol-3-phosphate 3-phosphatidyltransferase
MHAARAEIAPHAIAQGARFADVDGLARPVGVQIHTRLLRQVRDLSLEILDGHKLLWRAFEHLTEPFIIRRRSTMTFTGTIGTICMFPLRAIIRASVALGISPNTLTLIGVLINCAAGWALAGDRFVLAGFIMIGANIFDFIDGKVAFITGTQSEFGAFWDSTLDRFSDLALFTGLIWLYAKLGRTDYVLIATLTLIFSIMTSYARARAECLIEKLQGGLHGAARTHRLVHDRRVHQPDGRGAVGDPGAVGAVGRQPDSLHVSGAQQQTDAVDDRHARRLQPRVLLA